MQVLASLRVEQQKPEEALQHLRTSMNKWFPSLQRMLADSDADSQDSNEQDDAIDAANDEIMAALPSFEFRFETAKLLIELDETTEAAVQVCACYYKTFTFLHSGLLNFGIHMRPATAESISGQQSLTTSLQAYQCPCKCLQLHAEHHAALLLKMLEVYGKA